MTTLVARLREAIDAEEARLHALPPFPWKLNPDDDTEVFAADDVVLAEAWALSSNQQRLVAAHIVAGSPDRGLRVVKLHRKIIDDHNLRTKVLGDKVCYFCPTCGGRDWDIDEIGEEPCDTVLALAEVYGVEA